MSIDVYLRAEDQRTAEQIAKSDDPVLLTGPHGSGKSTLAKWIHDRSTRRGRPFIHLNCTAIPSNLVESELFGHVANAFTGATFRHGAVASAQDGTLFLDEIGDMPLELQPKLLSLLEEREYRRVGSDKSEMAKCRFVCATNQGLEALCAAGRFRRDLYYRINTLPLAMPPLRDLDGAALKIARRLADEHIPAPSTRAEVVRAVEELSTLPNAWPGNVRELKTFIKRSKTLGLEDARRLLLREWTQAHLPEERAPAPQIVRAPAAPPGDCAQLALLIQRCLRDEAPGSTGGQPRRGRPKAAGSTEASRRLAARLLGGPLTKGEFKDILAVEDARTVDTNLAVLKRAGIVRHVGDELEAVWPPAETWLLERRHGVWAPLGTQEIPVARTGDLLRIEVRTRCNAQLGVLVITHVRGREPVPSPAIVDRKRVTEDKPVAVDIKLSGAPGLEQIVVHLAPPAVRGAVAIDTADPEPVMPDQAQIELGRGIAIDLWGPGWLAEHRVFHVG
ncbi:sigma 54-interacting transcriptional regulator [Sorangium sp. So ce1153]|uniref:sigma 54-interacting transcriptional regulator n=1 Tax=Sorangium sp. So ce1153 TaxID=3133333 RepID=UPI003F61C67F